MQRVPTGHHVLCLMHLATYDCATLCSRWRRSHRFSLYEPVEFINTFLKDKLEWDQVTFSAAHCLPSSLVRRLSKLLIQLEWDQEFLLPASCSSSSLV